MYGEAMKRIVSRLKNEYNFPVATSTAVDFFAREGGWQTIAFANEVDKICAWEIDAQFLPNLKANLPQTAEITIGDSYGLAKKTENQHRFDFIVFDNPQGIFGDGKCEHFEALSLIPTLAKERSVVIFNVNIQPFNYDQHPEWADRRAQYYEQNAEILNLDFVLDFYKSKLKETGFEVNIIFAENRAPANYLYSIVCLCKKLL